MGGRRVLAAYVGVVTASQQQCSTDQRWSHPALCGNFTQADLGVVVNAISCADMCLANASCGVYTWFPPSDSLSNLAGHCVNCDLCASGCVVPPTLCSDSSCTARVAGKRVASPWPTDGFSELQTLWFGANETGLDSEETLALVGRHSHCLGRHSHCHHFCCCIHLGSGDTQ